MENISELWKKYNEYVLKISKVLGRTNNIVGEYAEHLINNHLKGKLLDTSTASADIKTADNNLYQVKCRKVHENIVTQLGIIRSWNFDYLAVVIFNQSGEVLKAIICPKETANKYADFNSHQNGWVITTSLDFLNDPSNQNITEIIRKYNGDSNVTENDKEINTVTVPTYINTDPQQPTADQNENKISKSEALLIINTYMDKKLKQPINKKQFVFSNQNKATNQWWFEPKTEILQYDLYIALNDYKEKILYLFKVPGKELVPADEYFRIRPDLKKPTITISGNDTAEFKDSNKGEAGVVFKKYLIETIEYKA